MWVFAAVSTVEPAITHLETSRRAYAGEAWSASALEPLTDVVSRRLEALELELAEREWLVDTFSVADILMIQTLRRLEGTELLDDFAGLQALVERGQARPAFRRAFDAQRETWLKTSAPQGRHSA
jgi:glutathione S-transferase